MMFQELSTNYAGCMMYIEVERRTRYFILFFLPEVWGKQATPSVCAITSPQFDVFQMSSAEIFTAIMYHCSQCT